MKDWGRLGETWKTGRDWERFGSVGKTGGDWGGGGDRVNGTEPAARGDESRRGAV